MSLSLIGKLKFRKRREKLFGDGRPRPMDGNAKARVMVYARALMRRTEAIKALEDAGVLSWVNRIKRVAEASIDLFGHRIRKTRVLRTSNGYQFIDPQPSKMPQSLGNSSKSDFPSGTSIQESIP